MNEIIECMDIGGTWFRIGLIQNGKILHQLTTPTQSTKLLNQIKTASEDIRKKFSGKIDYTVIGVPGPVKGNVLLNSAPLQLKEKIDFNSIQNYFSNHLLVENDLNLAVRAEKEYGAGKKCKNFYLLTISTGIGAGIVVDGKIISGTGGEFGHNAIDNTEHALQCGCGRKGCWVTMSAGLGIQLQAEKKLGKKISSETIFEMNNLEAREIIQKVREGNARGIGSMVNALEVEEIVVMGSIGINQFEKIIPEKSEIEKFTVNPVPRISKTQLGENIGLIGAYCAGIKILKQ